MADLRTSASSTTGQSTPYITRYAWFDPSTDVSFVTVRHSRPGRRVAGWVTDQVGDRSSGRGQARWVRGAGATAGRGCGQLKRRASRRHRTGACGRHRRCGTGDRDVAAAARQVRAGKADRFPRAPPAQGPAGWSRRHGRAGAASERLRTARQRCLPQPSSGPLASALPGPSTSIPRGVGSAGGMISSGVRGVAADLPVLAGRSP